jgi:hypothetical protein
MKTYFKLFLTILVMTSFCVPIYAFQIKHLKHTLKTNNSPALFTFIITTSDGKSFEALADQTEYVGKSTTKPCSDLVLLDREKDTIEIEPEMITVTSDDFIDYPGPGYSCFRGDMVIAGKTYSTGNIQLLWDPVNKMYLSANPKEVTMRF